MLNCAVTEVVDACASIPTLQMGESTANIATDMDIISYKVPLGITASICPFNFPAMIPLWSFPISVACGNAAILKPSERVPGASMILADLFTKAGAPAGLLNIIHGQHAAVDFICEHPDIKAVSFVGSDQAVSEDESRTGNNIETVFRASSQIDLLLLAFFLYTTHDKKKYTKTIYLKNRKKSFIL